MPAASAALPAPFRPWDIRGYWWCRPTRNGRSPWTPWPYSTTEHCRRPALAKTGEFMHTFFIAPTGFGVGLTSISLGLVRTLQRAGLKVGFFKPIAQPHPGDAGPERSSELIARTHGLQPPR